MEIFTTIKGRIAILLSWDKCKLVTTNTSQRIRETVLNAFNDHIKKMLGRHTDIMCTDKCS